MALLDDGLAEGGDFFGLADADADGFVFCLFFEGLFEGGGVLGDEGGGDE